MNYVWYNRSVLVAYHLRFGKTEVTPQTFNSNRSTGYPIRCVADPTVTSSDFTYEGDIFWEESLDGNVNVNVPSILTIDATSGMDEIANASKVIEGTATATISSNTEYAVTLHSTQPSLKDIENSTNALGISPVSESNPVQPGNNSWGLWGGISDPKTYTLPITTIPTEFPSITEDTTNIPGDPAKKHTYYVGISISPALPSGTYGTDVVITAAVK